jgi:anti-sigma factor ChrR (cupin superfamily)
LLAGAVDQVDPPPSLRDRVLAAAKAPGRYTIHNSSADWADSGLPGIRTKVLAVDKVHGVVTLLIRAEPGAVYPSHHHSGSEECYVLSGSIVIDGRILRPGDFHHADGESDHGEIMTTEGAEVLLVGAVADYMPR